MLTMAAIPMTARGRAFAWHTARVPVESRCRTARLILGALGGGRDAHHRPAEGQDVWTRLRAMRGLGPKLTATRAAPGGCTAFGPRRRLCRPAQVIDCEFRHRRRPADLGALCTTAISATFTGDAKA